MGNWTGQWLGRFDGNWRGDFTVDVETNGTASSVLASTFPDEPAVPPSHVEFGIQGEPDTFDSGVTVASSDALTGMRLSAEQASTAGFTIPSHANLSIRISGDEMDVSWKTEIGTSGTGKAYRSRALKPSDLPVTKIDWRKFRDLTEHMAGTPDSMIYRGQAHPWRLRTAFHRTSKNNLLRYNDLAIPELHRNLSSQTRHYYHIDDPTERGAFYALAQHHGFPTPLLDWTRSPFVAAYFAFHGPPPSVEDAYARIYIFDILSWHASRPIVVRPALQRPFVSIFDTVIIDNSRISPQRGLFTLSNVDDMETFIAEAETNSRQTCLRAIDLPWAERDKILDELALMGVTHASLFPGLDGMCRAFSRKFFRI